MNLVCIIVGITFYLLNLVVAQNVDIDLSGKPVQGEAKIFRIWPKIFGFCVKSLQIEAKNLQICGQKSLDWAKNLQIHGQKSLDLRPKVFGLRPKVSGRPKTSQLSKKSVFHEDFEVFGRPETFVLNPETFSLKSRDFWPRSRDFWHKIQRFLAKI